jgi:hypothetical protein
MSSLTSPWGDVGPEQRGQAAPVRVGQLRGPPVVGEHVLHHQGVDVDQGGLQHARAVLFRWNVRRCCSMAEGRVAAVFKLNGKGIYLRRGVARSVVMLVPLVVLGVLDQQKFLVSVAFGALFEGLCDPGGDPGCRVPRMAVVGVSGALLTSLAYWLGAATWGWVPAGSVVTLLAGLWPAAIVPAFVSFTELGPMIILGAIVRPVRRASGLSVRAVREQRRPS